MPILMEFPTLMGSVGGWVFMLDSNNDLEEIYASYRPVSASLRPRMPKCYVDST